MLTQGIKYYIALQVISIFVIMIFRRKFYFFESFRDFVDDIFNQSVARVKIVINKVEKTREVKFPPKNHYYKTTYNL